MAGPTVKIAKLNDTDMRSRLRASMAYSSAMFVQSSPAELPTVEAGRESERKQLAFKKAKALAKALNTAIVEDLTRPSKRFETTPCTGALRSPAPSGSSPL